MICASLVLLQIMFAVHRFAQGETADPPLRVVVAAPPQIIKKGGAAGTASCVEGLCIAFGQGGAKP